MPSNTEGGTYTFTTGPEERVFTLTLTKDQLYLLQETVEKVKALKQEEVQDLKELEHVLRNAK